jgi:hypothetical protein
MMKRSVFENQIVCEDMLRPVELLVSAVNECEGPTVVYDEERKCYGLKAEKMYLKKQLVTTYGGTLHTKERQGDYVAYGGDVYIDGLFGFKLKEKGRWINESDAERKNVNVQLGRNVRAIRDIEAGEWIFADYGPDYKRDY